MEGSVVPSKVYGIAEAGRPVLTIGALNGEIAHLIEGRHCGITIQPRELNGLVDAITHLAGQNALRATFGGNGRKALENYRDMH